MKVIRNDDEEGVFEVEGSRIVVGNFIGDVKIFVEETTDFWTSGVNEVLVADDRLDVCFPYSTRDALLVNVFDECFEGMRLLDVVLDRLDGIVAFIPRSVGSDFDGLEMVEEMPTGLVREG